MDKGLEKIKEAYYERSYVDAGVGPTRLRGREKELIVDLEVSLEHEALLRPRLRPTLLLEGLLRQGLDLDQAPFERPRRVCEA